jgi:hypothetical protein
MTAPATGHTRPLQAANTPPLSGQNMTTQTSTASAEPGHRQPGSKMARPVSTEGAKAGDSALAQARARHPQWGIWISSAGRYWATRMGHARLAERMHPGWAMTVDADSLPELGTRIKAQAEYGQAPGPSPEVIRADAGPGAP